MVAIGSNGAPDQLAWKFAGDRPPVVPVTITNVRGIAPAHSPHVSRAGYVPYVPVADPIRYNTRPLPVLWLDDQQLRTLDVTEPNY